MIDLVDPRSDGLCGRCKKRQAKTTDGRYCLRCLRWVLRQENPIEYHSPSDGEIDAEFDFDNVVDDLVKGCEEFPDF